MFGVSTSSGTLSNDYGHFGTDHASFSLPPSSNPPVTDEQGALSSSPIPNPEETQEAEEESSKQTQAGEDDSVVEDVPSMTLTITNVVCMANMRCHLRLKEIARSSVNVEYKALQNHVIMRLRKPYTVATIWSSGKIWCTGASSLAKARQGARRIARRISKVGFPCRFSNYRIVNIMATCRLPFRVRLDQLVRERPKIMSYEPELAPGLNFKADKDSSTSLKLFSTGRIVIMGSSLGNISNLVEELVPLAALHQTDEPISDDEEELATPFGSRKAVASLHPFSALAADVPALADVLAEEEAAFLNGGGFFDDEDEDEEGPVGTDDDSGENDSFASGASEDSGGCSPAGTAAAARRRRRMKRARARSRYETPKPQTKPSESISWLNAEGVAGLMSEQDSNLAGNTAAVGNLYAVSAANNLLASDSKLSLLGANVVSGSTKRACITAYSGPEKPTSTSSPSSNLHSSSSSLPPQPVMTVDGGQQHLLQQQQQQQQILRLPAVTPQQSQQIIYAAPAVSSAATATAPTPQYIVTRPATAASPAPTAVSLQTSYMQPTITVTGATNFLPMDFAQRGITAVSQMASTAGNQTAKIVTVNQAGQTSIVRIVNPMQFNQQHSQFIQPYTFTTQGVLQAQTPGQPQQIVVGRLPMGATVINCTNTAAYHPTMMQSMQLQPAAQAPGTVVTTHPQFTNFVAPGYN